MYAIVVQLCWRMTNRTFRHVLPISHLCSCHSHSRQQTYSGGAHILTAASMATSAFAKARCFSRRDGQQNVLVTRHDPLEDGMFCLPLDPHTPPKPPAGTIWRMPSSRMMKNNQAGNTLWLSSRKNFQRMALHPFPSQVPVLPMFAYSVP